MALSPAFDTTSRVTSRSTLVAPAGTLSPALRSTGSDSPVKALSSKLANGEIRRPSAGKRPPAGTSMVLPGCSWLAGMVSRTPLRMRIALSGFNAISALTPLRARLAAQPSSRSPIKNSSSTIAASAVAPINSAPIAATLINVSMANQLPLLIRRTAWRAIGQRPTSVVRINAAWANWGCAASARRSPMRSTTRPACGCGITRSPSISCSTPCRILPEETLCSRPFWHPTRQMKRC